VDEVNERIKQIRAALGISQREFSRQIFISQNSFCEIEKGVRRVNDRIIQLISMQFNITRDWIKTGAGHMFRADKTSLNLEHLIEIYKQLEKPLQDYLLEQSESLLKLHNENTITRKSRKQVSGNQRFPVI